MANLNGNAIVALIKPVVLRQASLSGAPCPNVWYSFADDAVFIGPVGFCKVAEVTDGGTLKRLLVERLPAIFVGPANG